MIIMPAPRSTNRGGYGRQKTRQGDNKLETLLTKAFKRNNKYQGRLILQYDRQMDGRTDRWITDGRTDRQSRMDQRYRNFLHYRFQIQVVVNQENNTYTTCFQTYAILGNGQKLGGQRIGWTD